MSFDISPAPFLVLNSLATKVDGEIVKDTGIELRRIDQQKYKGIEWYRFMLAFRPAMKRLLCNELRSLSVSTEWSMIHLEISWVWSMDHLWGSYPENQRSKAVRELSDLSMGTGPDWWKVCRMKCAAPFFKLFFRAGCFRRSGTHTNQNMKSKSH